MRKKSLILALILLINTLSFSVFAKELSINVYPEGVTEYKGGDIAVISGSCEAGKDIVLRIYNDKDSLIYTDIFPAYENTDGTYVFDEFEVPKVSSEQKYTVVVSEDHGKDDGKVEKANFTVGKSNNPDPPKPNINHTQETDKTDINWTGSVTGEESEVWAEEEFPAYENPVNPYDRNEKLWAKVGSVKTTLEARSAITQITKATNKKALEYETARNNVALAGEVMAANISAKGVATGRNNSLDLSDYSVTDKDLATLENTMTAIESAIKDNQITLNREMKRELVLNVRFDNYRAAKITISKKLIEKLANANVDILTIKDIDFAVSYTIDELREMLGDEESVSFSVNKSEMTDTVKKISVNFGTDTTRNVKISFPGMKDDTRYMAIVDENGNAVGGRYNPATGVLEAKIAESGVYKIVNNEKDFTDIKDKSEEMQESIKILAAKGIIEGTSETEFSPDDTITRAEVAALLLRVISEVDANADGGFIDVKQNDWFFGVAGSAKNYGMIQGFEDNSFRGREVIEKDQILTIAARILKKEMLYKNPENIEQWLTFSDSSSIADWARPEIAVAVMANIITRSEDNYIRSDEEMTRGDASLIIMRLFYKIW